MSHYKALCTAQVDLALRAIVAGLIRSHRDTMYYKKEVVREEVVAIVVISCAACFVLAGSIGFLLAAICAMAPK